MRITPLTTKWDHLMMLCAREKEYLADARHPKVLKLVSKQIEEIAAEMGFSARQIERREFRAERENGRVKRILTE
jgi:hypothetical protein